MALIGSVVNQGSMQGQINEANGNLTGLISSAELIGGQVVGMRGLKGDKGDQGDPGADGQDGADGFSPIANVSKVGDTATITITDSLGTTTATVEDGADGQDGQDGADGHSPVITANKVGKVTTVYVDGVAIATINDGQDGGGSSGDNLTLSLEGSAPETGANFFDLENLDTGNGLIIHDSNHWETYIGELQADKIETAGTGLSKDGTTLNHSNAITAQTTSGIYPVKIDAQGHITSYGSNLNLKNGVGSGSLMSTDASTIYNAGAHSLAIGYRTSASGANAVSLGYWNDASGNVSFAMGEEVIAQRKNNTVIGKFNIKDTGGSDNTTNGDYAFIVGNGTGSSARSNALTLDWSGNLVASGDVTDGTGNVLSDKADTSSVPTVSDLLDVFYPVGSYYETSDTSFDPNVAWGGTWVQETSGQVHVSAGGSYSVSGALNNTSDGGASTVKLTSAQSGVPKHSHTYTRPTVVTGGGGHSHTVTLKYRNAVPTNGSSAQPWTEGNLSSTGTVTIASNSGTHSHTLTGGGVADNTDAGASSAHNNMQPYIVVNRWHRTA